MYAQFEIRQKNLAAARKALGAAIGMAPKDKLFKGYIELELQVLFSSALLLDPRSHVHIFQALRAGKMSNSLREIFGIQPC